VIKEALPAGVTFVSASNGGTFVNGIITWNVGTLGRQTTAQVVSFTVIVTTTSGTVVNGTYTIEGSGFGPVLGPPATATVTGACAAPANGLTLLGGKVAVTMAYQNQYDPTVTCALQGSALKQNDVFGYFYFTDPTVPEVMIKVLDFGGPDYLLFFGTVSDFQMTVTFTSLATCQSVVYTKPAGGNCGATDTVSLRK
jgi:hypothetical protein